MKQAFLGIVALALISAGCNSSSTSTTTDSSDAPATADTTTPANVTAATGTAVEKTADYDNKFHFKVVGGDKSFTLTYTGYAEDSTPFTQEIDGKVIDLQTGELDGDNKPEVAVITQDNSGNSKAYVYSSNGDKSLSSVNLPDAPEKSLKGFKGHDDYAFVEQYFIHRFPLYNEDGTESGKTRQLQYKLKPGEAMKQLVLAKTDEY